MTLSPHQPAGPKVLVPERPAPAPKIGPSAGPTIARLDVSTYTIPTASPEADGTIAWDATTMVLVEVASNAGQRGLGFSYASSAAALLIKDVLSSRVIGRPVDDVRAIWGDLIRALRNAGRPGVGSTAIAAVDVALWDLKARTAGQALFRHLGAHRDAVPIYGSGGFTSYTDQQLAEQLGGWVAEGIPRVKMKLGADWGTKPDVDLARVRLARQAIGPDAELFVDANGAYTAKQAIELARHFAEYGATWFEEPVSSDQLDQLAFIRGQVPMRVAAGEYGFDPWYFASMLRAGAVDVLQADSTRCLGFDGFLEASHLAHGFGIPFSAHTAPTLHAQIGCVVPELLNVEYFFDHARIEEMFFDGLPRRVGGYLYPDPDRPGLGLELKRQDAEKYRA